MAEPQNLAEVANQLQTQMREMQAQMREMQDEWKRVLTEKGETRKLDTDAEKGETRRSSTDSFRDATRRGTDAKSQLFRGMTLASLEGLRLAANVVGAFTDEVFQRNRVKEGESVTAQDLIRDLPGDLIAGFAEAVRDTVDIPRRTAEKFSEAYKEGERKEDTRREDTRREDTRRRVGVYEDARREDARREGERS